MRQYYAWLYTDHGPYSSPRHQPTQGITQIQGGIAIPNTRSTYLTTDRLSETSTSRISQVPITGGSEIMLSSTEPPATTGGGCHRDRLLFWCVNLSPTLTVVRNLKVTVADRYKDQETFMDLRAEYRRIRGWRFWFSLYTISNIKFVKVYPAIVVLTDRNINSSTLV